MNAEALVKLIEEMIDLKVQQHIETGVKAPAELAWLVQEKRATDRNRLAQIKSELLRLLQN